MIDPTDIQTTQLPQEREGRLRLGEVLRTSAIPDATLTENLSLFLTSKELSRLIFMHELYRQIITMPGIVMEFGTRWGANLGLWHACRAMYEPFNRHRTIVGFDTFAGFPAVTPEDGTASLMKVGNAATTKGYEEELQKTLLVKESLEPLSHLPTKTRLVKGDATVTLPAYLTQYPHTIIALAYFDFDLYEPTKKCLATILPYCTRGTVLGFDELNDPDSPGETQALKEVLGLQHIQLQRLSFCSRTSYLIL